MPTPTLNSGLKAFARRRREFRQMCIRAEKAVRPVIRDVQREGDKAVFKYTKRWDRANLKNLAVTDGEFEYAQGQVDTAQRLVLEAVIDRFRKFYETQKLRGAPFVDDTGFYSERVAPLDRVGLYVPAGKAPLISTLLMLAVPAKVAGVPERFVATPPRPDGSIPPLIAAAAKLTGVTSVFKMGGAQAVAAFAFGTRTVPKVDKIFGPGNIFVTTAKKLLFGEVGIDMPAGPSELVVIADDTASADFLAEDLMAQAEHGPDSLSILLTTSAKLGSEVKNRIAKDKTSIGKQIFIVYLKTVPACIAAAADIAPEHLGLCVADPEKVLPDIGPAGAIFVGSSCIAYGDYVAGPNHTLPTAGAARFFSPLSLESFFRRSSILRIRDNDGELARIGSALADWEGLVHHARSLKIRAEK